VQLFVQLTKSIHFENPLFDRLLKIEETGNGEIFFHKSKSHLFQSFVGSRVAGVGLADDPLQIVCFEEMGERQLDKLGASSLLSGIGMPEVQMHVCLYALLDHIDVTMPNRLVIH